MKNSQLLRQLSDPHGFGEMAAAHVPPGQTQHSPRGAAREFRTRKVVFVLIGVLVACVCLAPSLHAAFEPITFTAVSQTVLPGGSVTVPITTTLFSSMAGASFSISWDTSVLTYVGYTAYNSTLSGTGFGLPFNATQVGSGLFGFAWADSTGNGVTLTPDGQTVFALQFTAIGAYGTSSTITFGNSPVLQDVLYQSGTEGQPTVFNGTVRVVPEPINWALGLFACVFIGSATVRWVSNRRVSLPSAQTASPDVLGA